MLFKSAILTQASGSIGGMTASHNKGGMYFRARTIPTDPNTSFQAAVRVIMASLVARWSSVATQEQRDAWELYASLVSVTNPLGDPIFVSGLNMFVRTNLPYVQGGGVIIFDAPTTFNLTDVGPASFVAAGALNTITVTYNSAEWGIIDGGMLLIYQGRPQNATINFFKGPWRLGAVVDGDTAVPPVSPEIFTSQFALAAGQKLWLQLRAVTPDGRSSAKTVLGPVIVGA